MPPLTRRCRPIWYDTLACVKRYSPAGTKTPRATSNGSTIASKALVTSEFRKSPLLNSALNWPWYSSDSTPPVAPVM